MPCSRTRPRLVRAVFRPLRWPKTGPESRLLLQATLGPVPDLREPACSRACSTEQCLRRRRRRRRRPPPPAGRPPVGRRPKGEKNFRGYCLQLLAANLLPTTQIPSVSPHFSNFRMSYARLNRSRYPPSSRARQTPSRGRGTRRYSARRYRPAYPVRGRKPWRSGPSTHFSRRRPYYAGSRTRPSSYRWIRHAADAASYFLPYKLRAGYNAARSAYGAYEQGFHNTVASAADSTARAVVSTAKSGASWLGSAVWAGLTTMASAPN